MLRFVLRASPRLAIVLVAPLIVAASGWRGDGTGRFPNADPPLRWSPEKHVTWKTALPAEGNATAVLAGDRVCVTAEPSTVLCLRKSDGTVLWSHEVGWLDTLPPDERARGRAAVEEAEAIARRVDEVRLEIGALRRTLRKKSATPETKARLEELTKDSDALRIRAQQTAHLRAPLPLPVVGYASSTPVIAGETLVVAFGTGLVAGFSLGGELLWARSLPWDEKSMNGYPHGTAASLVAWRDLVLVPLGPLHALELKTGKTRWTGPLYRDFGTPVIVRHGSDDVVLSPSGTALRAADGRVLGEKLAWTMYLGPAVEGPSRVYFAGNTASLAPDPAQATAYDVGKGNRFSLATAWKTALPNGRWVATPLVDGDHLVLVQERGLLVALGKADGKVVAERELRLEAEAFPSPVRAGDYLYVSDVDGLTVVLEARPPFTEVARNRLEPFRATPVFEGRRMYVRTLKSLYCIETP